MHLVSCIVSAAASKPKTDKTQEKDKNQKPTVSISLPQLKPKTEAKVTDKATQDKKEEEDGAKDKQGSESKAKVDEASKGVAVKDDDDKNRKGDEKPETDSETL